MRCLLQLVLNLLIWRFSAIFAYFDCPHRCQCYEDNEQSTQVHLICKWEQINSTSLSNLSRPELIRTLTIRCPYHSPKVSTPIPAMFQRLRNLDRLEIDRCLMENVPETLFAGLHQLYSLIMKNGKISDLPREIFAHVPNLMMLDLSGNQLRIEPYSLKSLQNLLHLDLSDNNIGFLTNTMVSLTKLKVITMNNNRLTNIDFRRFPEHLTDLSLRHNQISTMHYLRATARHLKRLDLAANRLEFIAGLASGSINVLPSELKHVDLSENRIKFLQENALGHLEHLVLIDFKNNSIKEAKHSSFKGPKGEFKLFLANNPLSCHCMHKWLMHSKLKNITIADLEAVQCVSLMHPHKMMLLKLAVERNDLLCKYSNMCEANCECCERSMCSCRFQCPPSCRCLRSADTSSPRVCYQFQRKKK
ncbi:unnamed protein product [Caenorhabditis bovis]|uniref:LRRNT domain-containing protein n=1 Tax=Caenorhabditis bovis TaxID=2654633 RepID=A0A8S1F1A0_9PELO|nr:unnamed protein product [Caenorhabditis bovis]